MGDFVSFRRMITPIIIQILFWVGVIVAIGVGIKLAIDGIRGSSADLFMGIVLIILGPFAVRISCEALILSFRVNETLTDMRILFFRMNETLTDIRNDLARQSLGSQRPVRGAEQAPRAPAPHQPAAGTTSAIAATPPEPERDTWDKCEIRPEVVRRIVIRGETARFVARFVAEASGQNGPYVAGTSPTFTALGDIVSSRSPVSEAFKPQLQELLDQLARDDWKPLPQGDAWYSYRFQRPAA